MSGKQTLFRGDPGSPSILPRVRAISLAEGRIVETPVGVAFASFPEGACAVICLVRFAPGPGGR